MNIEKEAKYKRIGERLIQTMPELDYIKDSTVRIAYLESDEEKQKNRKVVLADCTKVSSRYQWCCPYDFMITVYKPNIDELNFNKRQIEALIFHELQHVGIDNEGNEPTYYVVAHDIEEFFSVIERYGEQWQRRT